jgi:hypothetical protein
MCDFLQANSRFGLSALKGRLNASNRSLACGTRQRREMTCAYSSFRGQNPNIGLARIARRFSARCIRFKASDWTRTARVISGTARRLA